MNRILERIKNEKIKLVSHDEDEGYFAFHYDNTVYFPKNADLNELNNQYSMAHEIAHIKQFDEGTSIKKEWNDYARDRDFFQTIGTHLFVLWNEWDAWKKGEAICKEEEIELSGYKRHAWTCFKTYLKWHGKKMAKLFTFSYFPLLLLVKILSWDTDFADFLKESHTLYFFLLVLVEIGIFSCVFIEYLTNKEKKPC